MLVTKWDSQWEGEREEKWQEKSCLCWGGEATCTEFLVNCVHPAVRWERGGEPNREVVPSASVSLVVSALTHSIGRGGNRRAAGPLGSDTWCCRRGRRQEQSLQDSGRTYGDPQEGGRSSIHSTAASPSLICSKWERLVQLLDVISQALGVEARKGFSSKRRSVSGPGWGCTGTETNSLFLISPFALPQKKCKRSKGILSYRGICS